MNNKNNDNRNNNSMSISLEICYGTSIGIVVGIMTEKGIEIASLDPIVALRSN